MVHIKFFVDLFSELLLLFKIFFKAEHKKISTEIWNKEKRILNISRCIRNFDLNKYCDTVGVNDNLPFSKSSHLK